MRVLPVSLRAICALGLFFPLVACSGGGSASDTDGGPDSVGDVPGDITGDVPDGDPADLFRLDPAPARVSDAPFPNNIYLRTGALVVPSMATDPVMSTLANAKTLELLDQRITGRDAFGSTSAVQFFMNGEPDIASFEGRVSIVGLTGSRANDVIPTDVWWFAPGQIVGVKPAFGHYLVPGDTYAVLIEAGVKTATGEEIIAPTGLADILAAAAPSDATEAITSARAAWSELRGWIDRESRDPSAWVMATVFTTQETLPLAASMFQVADNFTLEPPTRRVSWDVDAAAFVTSEPLTGADLETYFGVPEAPFEFNPGRWGSGSRADAEALSGSVYVGGTYHAGISQVINGSIVAPALNQSVVQIEGVDTAKSRGLTLQAGLPTFDARVAVPFTLYLCKGAGTQDLPVAIFTHGGTAIRADAISFANVNCLSGVATIAMDQVFHGGRISTAVVGGDLIAPTRVDLENEYTGLVEGDSGFVGDQIGDNGGATETVAPQFAIADRFDPDIIEANLLTIPFEQKLLARYLAEGDWSQVLADLSFDGDRIFHQSLSFGTSFATPLHALSDDFLGVVSSVGSGMIVSANLPVAPSNASIAAPILQGTFGLKTSAPDLILGAWRDPIMATLQWLVERADPLGAAPFVLRERAGTGELNLLSSGDSWDETLYSPAQLSYNSALGLTVYADDGPWVLDTTVPGAASVDAIPLPTGGVAGNLTIGGRTHTAGMFYNSKSCHSQIVTTICSPDYEPPHPPAVKKATPEIFESPICQIHHQIKAFNDSLLAGDAHGLITAPTGTCAELYGP